MKSIKIIVKECETKEGVPFVSASVKGKYIPIAIALQEVNYKVRFVGDTKLPTKEGVYEVAFEDNGLWIDTREGYAEKNILRCRAVRVVFNKPLQHDAK